MPHIITISNQKGGVGKTTTAVNLAASLGCLGHPTLLVDIDPQANATSAVGLESDRIESSVYHALVLNQAPQLFNLNHSFKNLSILPSSIDLTGAEFELMDFENRERALTRVLSDLNGDYEYIIIDSPPSLGLLTLNALVVSEWVIIPVQAEYLALEGLSRMIMTIQRIQTSHHPDLQLLGIVVTLFDGRTNLSQQVLDELCNAFPGKILGTPISRSVRLSEAPSFGKPIPYYNARSTGAVQYMKLAEEVVHVCEKTSIGSGA
jgi:chromosome partitioning protein